MKNTERRFPDGFVWGAGTSAYQIEGAWNTDGKGPSVWDDFCRQKDAVRGGDSGNRACEHYHRFREDVALMRQLGLAAYRFSISWPRVFPSGIGELNQKGLDFYDALVDALLDAELGRLKKLPTRRERRELLDALRAFGCKQRRKQFLKAFHDA